MSESSITVELCEAEWNRDDFVARCALPRKHGGIHCAAVEGTDEVAAVISWSGLESALRRGHQIAQDLAVYRRAGGRL